MTTLSEKKCIPCKGDVPALRPEQYQPLLHQLDQWEVADQHHLWKEFRFPNFVQALSWVNVVAAVAEAEQHHPSISFTWGKVQIEIWTHKINALTENDFILAAHIDRAYQIAMTAA